MASQKITKNLDASISAIKDAARNLLTATASSYPDQVCSALRQVASAMETVSDLFNDFDCDFTRLQDEAADRATAKVLEQLAEQNAVVIMAPKQDA